MDRAKALEIQIATRADAIRALEADGQIVTDAKRVLANRGSRKLADKVDALLTEWMEQLIRMRDMQVVAIGQLEQITESEQRVLDGNR